MLPGNIYSIFIMSSALRSITHLPYQSDTNNKFVKTFIAC